MPATVPMDSRLPADTVTFPFTDIEGSTTFGIENKGGRGGP
jgi:hypothetical protein